MLATQPDTFVDALLTDSNIRLSVKMFKKLTVTKILTRINLIKKCHGKLYHKLRLSVKKDTLFKTLTLFPRINAAAFIKFFMIWVRRLFEGGVYSRAAFI